MSPEEKLEALLGAAKISDEILAKLEPAPSVARLLAAGFEVGYNVWGDPVAKLPFESWYHPAAKCVEFLDLVGDDGVAAVDAVARLRSPAEARVYRDDLVARARRERRKGGARG